MTSNNDSFNDPQSFSHQASSLVPLDPKIDVVFQALFADPRMKPSLIALLTAVIKPPTPIADLELLNTKLTKDRLEHKGSVVDVLVRLQDGTKVDVEMQMRAKGSLRSRALYYWAKIFASGLQVGDKYRKLMPTIVVIFLNEIEFFEDKNQYHHEFYATSHTNPNLTLKDFRVDFIELPRMPLLPVAINADKDLADWSQFLLNPGSESLEGVYLNNKNIKEALDRLIELSNDPEVVEAARQREMSGVLLTTSLEQAQETGVAIGIEIGQVEGEKKGKELGREEGKIQMFLSLQQSGILSGKTIQEIAHITGLKESEVEKILEESNKKPLLS